MRKKGFGINIGSSSLLMIFVILCLVSFATLSIVSANADRKLNKKVLERTARYYSACNEAEISIKNLDRVLENIYESADSEEAYYSTVGHEKEFIIEISDLQYLDVCVSILYPDLADASKYEITSWQVVTRDDILYDDSITLMQ